MKLEVVAESEKIFLKFNLYKLNKKIRYSSGINTFRKK